jgi:hypothetical protein
VDKKSAGELVERSTFGLVEDLAAAKFITSNFLTQGSSPPNILVPVQLSIPISFKFKK